jgi:hypothetical protein
VAGKDRTNDHLEISVVPFSASPKMRHPLSTISAQARRSSSRNVVLNGFWDEITADKTKGEVLAFACLPVGHTVFRVVENVAYQNFNSAGHFPLSRQNIVIFQAKNGRKLPAGI